MNKKEQQELTDVIVKNLEASKYIADNYQNIVNDIRERFRHDVIKNLNKKLDSSLFIIKSDLPIHQNFSKIWIHFVNLDQIPFSYCIEPFSAKGNSDGSMFVGLFGHNHAKCESLPNPLKLNEFWQHIHWLKTSEGNNLHLNSPNLLKELFSQEADSYNKLINGIVDQIVKFVEQTNKYVLEFK